MIASNEAQDPLEIMRIAVQIENIDLSDYEALEDSNASISYYIRLSKRYGLKLYRNESDRDGCFVRQKAAYSLGFGPKPLMTIEKDGFFGYVTEHAESTVLTDEELFRLKNAVRAMFWHAEDIDRDRNVGRINGEPVLIDFDDGTLENTYVYC